MQGGKAASKEAALLLLAARSFGGGSTIIFFATKQATHRMAMLFRFCGLPSSAELHGNLTQAQRLQSLELFRQVGPRLLVSKGAYNRACWNSGRVTGCLTEELV